MRIIICSESLPDVPGLLLCRPNALDPGPCLFAAITTTKYYCDRPRILLELKPSNKNEPEGRGGCEVGSGRGCEAEGEAVNQNDVTVLINVVEPEIDEEDFFKAVSQIHPLNSSRLFVLGPA